MRILCNDQIYFVRYGGDEFLGFFYDVEVAYVKQIAQHLYQEVKKLHVEHAKTLHYEKTISITIGCYYAIPKDMMISLNLSQKRIMNYTEEKIMAFQ